MGRGTSMATRLAASVVIVSVASLVVATIVGVTTGRDLAEDLNDERLRATVQSAAFDVGAEVGSLERMAEALSVSPQAVAALDEFETAYTTLEQLDRADLDDEAEELVMAYRTDYLEPLEDAGRDVVLRDIADDSSATIYLQYEYAIDIGPVARPQTVDDAGDGSDWSEVHEVFHPVYRSVVTRLDLLDLYLVEPDGTVLYSVGKRPDLGTDLATGPFSGSVLANTFDRVVNDPEGGAVASDLRFYDAVPGVPVGVIASPVLDGPRLAGVLMMTYDGAEITRLVTADQTWEEAGLPDTGDVFVIGADGRTRSDPRSYLEDPDAHLAAVEAEGRLTPEERATIDAVETTVLTQNVVDTTRDAGRDDDGSVSTRPNMTGTEVLSVVVPAETDSVRWFVVAEVDAETAESRLDDFQELLIVGTAIFVVVVAFLAVAWANRIIGPVRRISDRISRRSRSDEPIEVPPESPVEIQRIASHLDTMKNTIISQHEQLAEARGERLALLRSMLPPSVAARIASGDLRTIEEAPAASAVVVVVVGLAELVRADSAHADRELVDQLHAELDDLALEHGLDRIKVVGDAYFAVCGHDRQYIDHAPRAVTFALDAVEAVRDIQAAVPLGLAVGVHSGAVTTGTAGGARLVYDVWGPTVSTAHLLARQSARGEIRLSRDTRALLPDSIPTETTDDDATFRVASTIEGARTS